MDPFEILGVARDASQAEVARAFKRLAHEHHPDRNPGDPDAVVRFRRVKAAYDAIVAQRVGGVAPSTPRPRRAPATPKREPKPTAAPAVRSSDELESRLRRLGDAVDAVRSGVVTKAALESLVDAARWARLQVDLALAFKPHVATLRDAEWSARRFKTERAAMQTFGEFSDVLAPMPAAAFTVVELRNLRARLEGLMAVSDGWSRRL